jgi:putative sigma-54 modulation protein
MEIKIQSLHFKANNQLEDFVRNKVSKLSRLNDQIITGHVLLKIDKSKKSENKICEIKIPVPKKVLFAKRQCKSFEEAINDTVDALQQQLKKRKTQINKSVTI